MIISPSSLDTNLSQLLDEVNSGKHSSQSFRETGHGTITEYVAL